MAIYTTCECGKRLKAREDLAGQRVKCPSCGHLLVIGAETKTTPRDATSAAGRRTCSACSQPIPQTLAICPHCGAQAGDAAAPTGRSARPGSRTGGQAPLRLAALCLVLVALVAAGFWYLKGPGPDGQGDAGASGAPPSQTVQADQGPPKSKPKGYIGALVHTRKLARGTTAASTMRQIGYAITLYADQHGGLLPNTLRQLEPYVPALAQVLDGPTTPFIYVKPAERRSEIRSPSATPMLYESLNGEPNPHGSILYADSRVEMGQVSER